MLSRWRVDGKLRVWKWNILVQLCDTPVHHDLVRITTYNYLAVSLQILSKWKRASNLSARLVAGHMAVRQNQAFAVSPSDKRTAAA
jgi:hypothetical protein